MPSLREQIEDWPLGQLADAIGNENTYAPHARAELLRRDAEAQQEVYGAQKRAADAQELAARAAIETAKYTELNAKYMRYSVYVLAAAAAINLAFTAWDHFVR